MPRNRTKQWNSKSRFHHLWNILKDLRDGKFDYNKTEQILHHKNMSLLSLSLRSDDIIVRNKAISLCGSLIDEAALKNCLVKFIQYNGIRNFVHAIYLGILHISKSDANDPLQYEQFKSDIQLAIFAFTKL
eukprot:151678_1